MEKKLLALILVALLGGLGVGYGLGYVTYQPQIQNLQSDLNNLEDRFSKLENRAWYEVATFSGTGTKPGNEFYVLSDHWRIRWFASPSPLTEDTSFRFWMFTSEGIFHPYFESGTLTASDFDKQYFNQLAGVEYITGTGRFIIDVIADSAEWEIIVEAYH